MPIAPFAVSTVLGLPVMFSSEIQQGVQTGIGFKIDMTSPTAVTAVRSAFGNETFTTEADTACSAVACLDKDGRFIDEHRFWVHGSRFRVGRRS